MNGKSPKNEVSTKVVKVFEIGGSTNPSQNKSSLGKWIEAKP